MVETSAKENLQLAWSWIRELAKEANQLSMTTTKSKWLPISKLVHNIILLGNSEKEDNLQHNKKSDKKIKGMYM